MTDKREADSVTINPGLFKTLLYSFQIYQIFQSYNYFFFFTFQHSILYDESLPGHSTHAVVDFLGLREAEIRNSIS